MKIWHFPFVSTDVALAFAPSVLVLALAGCSTRTLPHEYPRRAASSPQAKSGAVPEFESTLRDDLRLEPEDSTSPGKVHDGHGAHVHEGHTHAH